MIIDHIGLECSSKKKCVGELERGKARVLCVKIKRFVWACSLVQDLARRKKEAWASSAK